MKEAAEELLRIADDIEKDAAEVTMFVCNKCNHTASLASINGKRQEMAKTAGEKVTVADITINDKVQCPACEGVMAYQETEASAPYYFDPDKKADDKEPKEPEVGPDGKPVKPVEATVDYDSL